MIFYFKVTRHYLDKTHSTKSISHETGMCGIEERVRSFNFFYSNIFISESIFLRSKHACELHLMDMNYLYCSKQPKRVVATNRGLKA